MSNETRLRESKMCVLKCGLAIHLVAPDDSSTDMSCALSTLLIDARFSLISMQLRSFASKIPENTMLSRMLA